MFVKKNKNRSGSVTVQIISKNFGKYKVVKLIGSAKDPDEVEKLVLRAEQIIANPNKNQLKLFSMKSRSALTIKSFVEGLKNTQVHTIGPELIFGTLFDRIGFSQIKNELFRHLVIARLAYPTSKLKTSDYLYRYKGVPVSTDSIYRFLDNLSNKYKKAVEDISFGYTKQSLGGTVSLLFYDMTTLYFETEDEDDLRKIGFSKDGKFQKPQIMIGLLVGKHGLPITYDIHKGNTFEGHTLMPILKKVQKRYGLGKPIVIADAALLSKKNLRDLTRNGYQFIIGARIKNESNEVKRKVLKRAGSIKNGGGFSIRKKDGTRLVVTYSDKRAKKDAYNRQRGIKKLRLKVKSGKLTKSNINNRGYNKFLTLTGEVEVSINEARIKEDEKWDGLKGYVTNTRLSPKSISENYSHLWRIENAFRISKTDLRIRPVYHRLRSRIEAHICICFVAYTIYKELERLLKKSGVAMSSKRAGELTQNMYELEYELPGEAGENKTLLKMDDEQKLLYEAIHGCG